jgi:glucose/arabinose dehydrogenase
MFSFDCRERYHEEETNTVSPEQAVTEAPVTDTATTETTTTGLKESWTIVVAPDGTIEVAPTPPPEAPPEQFLEWHRELFRNVPPGVAPKGGVMVMSRGNGAGSLNLHLYDGEAPARDQLRKLNPVVLSRWAARPD